MQSMTSVCQRKAAKPDPAYNLNSEAANILFIPPFSLYFPIRVIAQTGSILASSEMKTRNGSYFCRHALRLGFLRRLELDECDGRDPYQSPKRYEYGKNDGHTKSARKQALCKRHNNTPFSIVLCFLADRPQTAASESPNTPCDND
jgi:hypothetical protein